jgi:predicted Zn-dependent protease
MDQGEIRFALGLIYWKQNAWHGCIQSLRPFDEDSMLSADKSRPKALSMLGQSYFYRGDQTNCVRVLKTLIWDYPKFDGIEDAYSCAAQSCAATKNWKELDEIYKKYVAERGNSERRPRMDLLAARMALATGETAKGISTLKGLAAGDAPEEVRADAFFYLAQECAARNPPQWKEAAEFYVKSLDTFPREHLSLAAAKAYMELKDWDKAVKLLERTARDFPKGNEQVVAEARKLIPQVLKELTKTQPNEQPKTNPPQ